MPDLSQSLTILILLSLLVAVFWLLGALSAFANYRGFRRSADLGWMAAFLLLALSQALSAYTAAMWSDISAVPAGAIGPLEHAVGQDLRIAVFELVAALLIFTLYRQRRMTF